MTFDDFKTLDFPSARVGVVYVLLYVADGAEVPFYVGETERFTGRMDDYLWADFKASTDFKVGEAVKYLQSAKGLKVIVRYKESADRQKEEKQLIARLRAEGFRLLNDLKGYVYRTANEQTERLAVQQFCEMLTSPRARAAAG